MKSECAIIGSGAWGSAIGVQACKNFNQVLIYGIEQDVCSEINAKHTNASVLPNIILPKNLIATSNIHDIKLADYIIIAVPSTALLTVLEEINQVKIKKDAKSR